MIILILWWLSVGATAAIVAYHAEAVLELPIGYRELDRRVLGVMVVAGPLVPAWRLFELAVNRWWDRG